MMAQILIYRLFSVCVEKKKKNPHAVLRVFAWDCGVVKDWAASERLNIELWRLNGAPGEWTKYCDDGVNWEEACKTRMGAKREAVKSERARECFLTDRKYSDKGIKAPYRGGKMSSNLTFLQS